MATAVFPSPQLLVLSLLVRLYDTWSLIPTIWDSYYWCASVDGGLLLLLLSGGFTRHTPRPFVSSWWAGTARSQLGIFYLASGFWKINKDFLNPRISCAPIFVLTLLTTLGVREPSPGLATALLNTAPLVTIVGEMAIGVLLLLPTRVGFTRIGVALALLLHTGIVLTPPPNNATPFAFACVVRLIVTTPFGFARAIDEATSNLSSLDTNRHSNGRAGLATSACAVAAAAICQAIQYARAAEHPPMGAGTASADPWVFGYAFLAVFCTRGLMLEAMGAAVRESPPLAMDDGGASGDTAPSAAAPVARRLRAGLVCVAAAYGFAGPLLGYQDLGSCNMYSNLRMHGGSNHLLLPTDLLSTLVPSVFAEGMRLVRVESCTSSWINSIYPNEITSQMSEHERSVLAKAGHVARMFNPAKSRILSPEIGAPPATYTRHETAVKWTVPTLELRRLLAEARARDEAFSLTYTLLDGQSGDERWRRTSGVRTVTLHEDGKGGVVCSTCGASPLGWVLSNVNIGGACDCAPDELPLLPPPHYLARKLLVQQPYPIVGEEADAEEGFICFGP